jgi:GTP-binding protein HflX
MLDRPRSGERAILVHVQGAGPWRDDEIGEFRELAVSAGAECLAESQVRLRRKDARYLIGPGKVDEIAALCAENDAELVIVNSPLSPAQERNLERKLECRVVDRIGLILDIFAQRASTFEGKLQVELAQLRHLSTRLVRGWTHLERQKGGIGLRGGPGEKQLETDRRLINERIRRISLRLDGVSRRRELSRRARARSQTPVVSLVGYTNAGKSTLFNALTDSGVYVADKLFATLDPTLRRLQLDAGSEVVLVDTVGFIRDLPHDLVAAFRATLEETRAASALLHVVDVTASDRLDKIEQVDRVLNEIGAGEVPQIVVFNKCDQLASSRSGDVERDAAGVAQRVWVSAHSGSGLQALARAIAERVGAVRIERRLRLPPAAGRLRAKLFELGAVTAEQMEADGTSVLDVLIVPRDLQRLSADEGLSDAMIEQAGSNAA